MNFEYDNARAARAFLSVNDARDIYKYAQEHSRDGHWSPTIASAQLSEKYAISPKAIRDIWNRRTWTTATYEFWSEEEKREFSVKKSMVAAIPKPQAQTGKKAGRPLGSKDTKPRKRRNSNAGTGSSPVQQEVGGADSNLAYDLLEQQQDSPSMESLGEWKAELDSNSDAADSSSSTQLYYSAERPCSSPTNRNAFPQASAEQWMVDPERISLFLSLPVVELQPCEWFSECLVRT
eukprot:758889-Hanusia_phi.AAC.2